MARRTRLPGPLRPLVGSMVLVGTVRAIDAVWRRVTGRRPPSRDATEHGADATSDAAEGARAVRDGLLYALLLGAALRIARRAGLDDAD